MYLLSPSSKVSATAGATAATETTGATATKVTSASEATSSVYGRSCVERRVVTVRRIAIIFPCPYGSILSKFIVVAVVATISRVIGVPHSLPVISICISSVRAGASSVPAKVGSVIARITNPSVVSRS